MSQPAHYSWHFQYLISAQSLAPVERGPQLQPCELPQREAAVRGPPDVFPDEGQGQSTGKEEGVRGESGEKN